MNDQQILDSRWKKTDAALEKAYPRLKRIFREILDESVETVLGLGAGREDLAKKVPDRIKRKVLAKMTEWTEKGLDRDYLAYRMRSVKWTYSDVIDLLLLGLYYEKAKKIIGLSYETFNESAQDIYLQAQRDLGPKKPKGLPKLLPWAFILPLLIVPVVMEPYDVYVYSLATIDANDLKNSIMASIYNEISIDEGKTWKLLIKQQNRILKIDNGRYSGTMDSMARSLGNRIYVEPFPNMKVRFVAEMDGKTTRMCRSLNGQIFNTKEMNRFERYSAQNGRNVTYIIKGLAQGINLPPIDDHFHWCRSTVVYEI